METGILSLNKVVFIFSVLLFSSCIGVQQRAVSIGESNDLLSVVPAGQPPVEGGGCNCFVVSSKNDSVIIDWEKSYFIRNKEKAGRFIGLATVDDSFFRRYKKSNINMVIGREQIVIYPLDHLKQMEQHYMPNKFENGIHGIHLSIKKGDETIDLDYLFKFGNDLKVWNIFVQ